MKNFAFRLEQVLRWRETLVRQQESRVSAASAALGRVHAELDGARSELAAARVDENPDGGVLGAYAAFRQRALARIRDLETQSAAANRTVEAEMNRLVEANQKMKVIGNLRQRSHSLWAREFDRDQTALADEAFLSRYNQ